MATKTRSKATDNNDQALAKAREELDKARTRNAPDPDRVVFALLRWWDNLTSEVNQTIGVLRKFRLTFSSSETLPGFEFAGEASDQLLAILEAIDAGRPMLNRLNAAELSEVIRELDVKGVGM